MRVIETDLVKERTFDENPRRHFADKRQALIDRLVIKLTTEGLLKEELIPTGKPNEYTMTLSINAQK